MAEVPDDDERDNISRAVELAREQRAGTVAALDRVAGVLRARAPVAVDSALAAHDARALINATLLYLDAVGEPRPPRADDEEPEVLEAARGNAERLAFIKTASALLALSLNEEDGAGDHADLVHFARDLQTAFARHENRSLFGTPDAPRAAAPNDYAGMGTRLRVAALRMLPGRRGNAWQFVLAVTKIVPDAKLDDLARVNCVLKLQAEFERSKHQKRYQGTDDERAKAMARAAFRAVLIATGEVSPAEATTRAAKLFGAERMRTTRERVTKKRPAKRARG